MKSYIEIALDIIKGNQIRLGVISLLYIFIICALWAN